MPALHRITRAFDKLYGVGSLQGNWLGSYELEIGSWSLGYFAYGSNFGVKQNKYIQISTLYHPTAAADRLQPSLKQRRGDGFDVVGLAHGVVVQHRHAELH